MEHDEMVKAAAVIAASIIQVNQPNHATLDKDANMRAAIARTSVQLVMAIDAQARQARSS